MPGETAQPPDVSASDSRVPIVGIGASAGGLKALWGFFAHTPPESGMAFVVILHLAPAFESNVAGNFDIYTVKPNGTGLVRLTSSADQEISASWSADGQQIAFASNRGGAWDLWIMNADGSDQRRLTSDAAFDEIPGFSPDGEWIVFDSTRDAPIACPTPNGACDAYTEVWKVRVDGSELTRLTFNTATDRFPTFSPDGSRIALASRRDGNIEIYSIAADGSDQTRITNRDGNDSQPSWSPDGTRLAYRVDAPGAADGSGDIWLMDADGGNARQLTSDAAPDLRPAWSPSGTQIAFRSLRAPAGIWIMKVDGTRERYLTTAGDADRYPDWQPLPAELD